MKYRRTPPAATVNRMARYLNYLTLIPPEQTRVNSKQISDALGIKPTQVRQDFHYFGGFGRPGRGYERDILIEALERILGVDQIQGMIILGVGHLGTALANYRYFERMNLRMVGLFDINPKLIGLKIRGIEIMHPDDIPSFVQNPEVTVGVITTPPEAAQKSCDQLIEAGIKGIWNFTPIQLKAQSGYFVRNEQPSLGLLALTFQLNEMQLSDQSDVSERKAFSFD